MSNSSLHRIGACVLAIALCVPTARAQDAATLQRENARLNAELNQLRNQCGTGGGARINQAGFGAEQKVGELAFSIASVRVGQAAGFTKKTMAVTTTMRIRNAGMAPVALNYNKETFSLVDDLGYGYKLYHEHSSGEQDVKGLSIASGSRAGTDDVLLPGQSVNVTFIPTRFMDDGETVGNSFDINATFGAYEDQGQGRVRRVRNYAVAFIGVPRSAGAQAVGESVRQSCRNVVDGVLKGLFGNGN